MTDRGRADEAERELANGGVRVLIAAGYPAVRAGYRDLIGREPGLTPIDSDPREDGGSRPDAIVVDVDSLGPDVLDGLLESYPAAAVVIVGGEPAEDGPGLDGGPIAYLRAESDGPEIAAAIRGVRLGLTVIDPELLPEAGPRPSPPVVYAAGERLTAREHEVLELVANGLPNKTIARELGISEHTAKFHVGSVLSKLNAASRTEAVTIATRRGILTV